MFKHDISVLIEWHRSFLYPNFAELGTVRIFYLASTDSLMSERGTAKESVRKHKLHISGMLEQLQDIKSLAILEAEQSRVFLVCQALQVLLLDDAGLDSSHLKGDHVLDGRWMFFDR